MTQLVEIAQHTAKLRVSATSEYIQYVQCTHSSVVCRCKGRSSWTGPHWKLHGSQESPIGLDLCCTEDSRVLLIILYSTDESIIHIGYSR